MKLRPSSKSFAAAIGLAFTALSAHAQLNLNVTQTATFGPFNGGVGNSVSNNGSTNINQVVSTGTGFFGIPFTVTYDPLTGPSVVTLATGSVDTTSFLFNSTIQAVDFFTSLPVSISTDFDSNGIIDVVQNYTLSLSPFMSPNGFAGVQYQITPTNYYGSVIINGDSYAYASAVANSTGVLLGGASTEAFIQFQFIATPVPEPSTYALAGVGVIGAIVALRRRRSGASSPTLQAPAA